MILKNFRSLNGDIINNNNITYSLSMDKETEIKFSDGFTYNFIYEELKVVK